MALQPHDRQPVLNATDRESAHYARDAVRALVSAMGQREGESVTPVSTLSIHHELRKRRIRADAKQTIRALQKVRDAQWLGEGYWLPVPTHILDVGTFALIVSSLPDQELRRLFHIAPIRLGLGRAMLPTEKSVLPKANLSYWLDAPPNSEKWGVDKIARTRFDVPETLEGLEVFMHWLKATPRRWELFSRKNVPPDGTVLGRFRMTTGAANHYLLRVRNGKIAGTSELPHGTDDVRRLQIVLRKLADAPEKYTVKELSNMELSEIEMPPIPISNMRFFDAIAEVTEDPNTGRMKAVVPNFTVDASCEMLDALGLERLESQKR